MSSILVKSKNASKANIKFYFSFGFLIDYRLLKTAANV